MDKLLKFVNDLVLQVQHDLGLIQGVRSSIGNAHFLLDFLHDRGNRVVTDSRRVVVLVDEGG